VTNLSLSHLPSHLQLLVFGALSLSATVAYYHFIDTPARVRMAERTRETATLRARLDKGVATARKFPEIQQEVADLERRLDSLGQILPHEKDAADLLRSVHGFAAQSSVAILAFRPQATLTRQLHAEWPIGLELEGTYHDLGVFLDRVSRHPRILNVTDLVILRKQQPHPQATVDVTCTVRTFVLIGEPPPAVVTPDRPRPVGWPPPLANFSYSSDGRRDPFVRLVSQNHDRATALPARQRPEGVAGLAVDEVVVRGIVRSRGGWIAIVSAPSGRTYFIRPGDTLMDGRVQFITDEAVVLLQALNDPLSRQKEREVRKHLRGEIQ
jgi:type IV pilus assembly protein PilO